MPDSWPVESGSSEIEAESASAIARSGCKFTSSLTESASIESEWMSSACCIDVDRRVRGTSEPIAVGNAVE